jgi:hypothetical protein
MGDESIITQTDNRQLVDRLDRQRRNLKSAVSTITSERDAARAERDTLAKELAEAKSKGDNTPLAKQNAELKARLTEIEHRKILDKKAIAKGVRPDAVDGFFKLSEYKAEGEPNEEQIEAFVDSQKEKLGYLFGEATAQQGEQKPPPKPGPGTGQGGKSGATSGFQLPADGDGRWSDPVWQWNNRAKIIEATKAKLELGQV